MLEAKWKRFEKLVAKIQADLSPTAVVRHDEKILGKKSGAARQIDVAVHQRVGQFELLVVIDCKDYKVPVDVSDVGQFIDLVMDVGANKGAIVSASGFTDAAKRRAKEAAIDLYRVIDAENEDWRVYVRMPVLWHFLGLRGFQPTFSAAGYLKGALEERQGLVLVDGDGQPLGSPAALVKRRWNQGSFPDEAGRHSELPIYDSPMFLQLDGRFYPVKACIDIDVFRESYFGYLPLTKVQGFYNEEKGSLITASGFTGDWISYAQIRDTWRRLDDAPEELAVKPMLEIESSFH